MKKTQISSLECSLYGASFLETWKLEFNLFIYLNHGRGAKWNDREELAEAERQQEFRRQTEGEEGNIPYREVELVFHRHRIIEKAGWRKWSALHVVKKCSYNQ